ncbi:TMEM14 family protein [Isosphaeraceae bacterium EP7]
MISHHVAQLSLAIYGLLLAVGGYIGFRKAGSTASLRAGLIAGVLAFIGAGTVTDNGVLGLKFGAFVAGAMGIIFAIRLAKTKKFMPSGLLLGLSLVELLILLLAIL